jgi:RHS repeat-associated protein
VFRLALDGKIYTFAGGVQRTPPDYGDGGPATQAFIPDACGLAIGPDGSVYISMRNTSRVRRVAPDGIISTFAGTGQIGFSGDGGPAINAKLFFPTGLSIDAEGNLYIADCRNNRIRRVTPSGIITTIAGNGVAIFSGDGGPATQASFVTPMDVACGPDGTLYITDSLNGRIRVVNSEGIIQTIAGKTAYYSFPPKYYGFVPDGVVALIADFSRLTWIAVAPDQSVYVSAQSFSSSHSIYRLTSPYPSYLAINLLIPSEDGSELYKFDSDGRHLKTTDALTGNALYTFEYDSLSNLTGVRDLDNLLTRIDRDSTGMPTAIVSPFGQRTELEADTSGFLADIRNAANETHSFVYDSTGLMAQMFDPKNNLYRFTYDSTGRLIKEEDPAGGFKTLARTTLADGSEVTVTTAEGQTSTYRIEKLATGGTRRTNTDAAGLATVTTETPDGVTTTTSPDGTITTVNLGPDPRFAMQAPLAKSTTVRMPSGLQSNSEHKRVITQMSGLQVTGIADTLIINGRKYVSVFDGNQKRYTFTSPEGRKTFAFIDSLGRVVQDSIPGVISVTSKYDSQGFLTQTSQDGRTSSFTYDGRGRLATVTDPLQRTTSTFYDSVGRVTRQVLPDTREILYAYDANGNLSSLTPPGRPAHSFDYTTVDLTQRYTPPLLNGDTTATRYKYDLDKRIKNTIRPDSVAVSVFYDTLGCGSCPSDARPKTIIFDRGTLDFAYNPTTGLLSSLSAPGGNVLTYTYDGTLPSSVTWSGEVMGSVGVAYDNNFRVTTQTVNSGNSVTFQYDRDGLLTSAGLLSIAHDPQNGRITGTTLGSVTTSQAYNAFGEMKNFSAVFASDTLFKTVYAPDSLGRITEIIETIQGQTRKLNYTYDQAGRLSEVSRNDTLVSIYTYDANGNRMSRITPSDTVNGSYDSQDRLLTYGGASYSYTRNGELSIKIVGTDTTRYTYDAFGNLVKVIMPNGDVIEYVIDGQNRRVGKKVNGNLKRRWLYQNGLNVIAELDGIGNMVSRFVYGTRPNTPDYVIKGGTIYRIVSDHLGSVRLVANTNSGAVTQQINYDEFGNVVFDSNPGFQPFSYAGGLYDEQTKLVRFGARDYEPMTGRWAQKDPIGFRGGQWNLYQYVGNNPVNFLDPNGFFFPGDHYDMSYMAARNLGFSIEAAKRIGYYTALADKDTQGKEWYFTRIHAMAGEIQIDENTSRYQTREEAMASTRAFVDEELRSANEALKIGDCESYYRGLGNALHAIQDRWAPLHNYSEWHPSIWSNIAHGLTHTFGVGLRTHYAPAVRSSEIFLGGDIAGALR